MFSDTKYRRDIQVLRGLAVLSVVLFHAKEEYFPLGYLGVDIFFVISGFVVTPLILRIFTEQPSGMYRRLSNLRYFYKRRFYRLAPALALTLGISALVVILFGPPYYHERFVRQGIATMFLAGNLGAFRYSGDYFSANPNPLVHTWSLSVEEQIYIFLPIILMLVLHNRKNISRITKYIFLFVTTISFISFQFPAILEPIYSKIGTNYEGSLFSFYSPIDRIWQFTLGGLSFLLLDRYKNRIERFLKIINPVLVAGLLLILFTPIEITLKSSSILASLLAVLTITFRSLELLPNFFSRKLEWLGDRSYSIYLVHMPLIYIAKFSPVTAIGEGENRNLQALIAVVVSILLGSLSYALVENKFRNRGKSRANELKPVGVALFITFFLPFSLFVILDRGIQHQYWGLDRNIPQPAYAIFLDPNCNRDSEMGPPCTYGQIKRSKRVLLIGDSHAGHISQAVVDAAKKQNWSATVWVHSGCTIQFERSVNGQVTDNCLAANKQMLAWILENKPDFVIVSQYIKAGSNLVNLRNALSKLHSVTPNILLVENNPIFPDGKDFMVSRPLIMSPYNPPKSFPESGMQIKDKNASDQLAFWAKSDGIATVNFWSLFCKNNSCSRYSDVGWLYRDDDHLSVSGAELTIPGFENFLKQF